MIKFLKIFFVTLVMIFFTTSVNAKEIKNNVPNVTLNNNLYNVMRNHLEASFKKLKTDYV